jgi:hypothetical protein
MRLVHYIRGDQVGFELISENDRAGMLSTIRAWSQTFSIESVLFATYSVFQSINDQAQQMVTLGGTTSPFQGLHSTGDHPAIVRQTVVLQDIRSATKAVQAAQQVAQAAFVQLGKPLAQAQAGSSALGQAGLATKTNLLNPGFDVTKLGFRLFSTTKEAAFARLFASNGKSPCIFYLLFGKCKHANGHVVGGSPRSHDTQKFSCAPDTSWDAVKLKWAQK